MFALTTSRVDARFWYHGSDTWNHNLYTIPAAHKRIVSSSAAQARTPFHSRVYQLPTLPFPSVSMANFARPFPDPGNGLLLGDIFSGIGGWELAANSEWEWRYLGMFSIFSKVRARLLRIFPLPEQLSSWTAPRARRSTRGQGAWEGT